MTASSAVKIYYYFKNICNILAIIALLAAGIAFFVVSTRLQSAKSESLSSVGPAGTITCGVFLIVIAVAPALILFYRVNLRKDIWNYFRTETLEELDLVETCPGNSTSEIIQSGPIVTKEEIVYTRTETMVAKFEDPRIRWNGQNMQSLIGSVASEGEMRFPRPPVTDTAAEIDDPTVLPKNPETTTFKQSEYLVEAAEVDGMFCATPAAFFDHLKPTLESGLIRLHRFY